MTEEVDLCERFGHAWFYEKHIWRGITVTFKRCKRCGYEPGGDQQ